MPHTKKTPGGGGHDPASPYSYREVLAERLRTIDAAVAEHFDDRAIHVMGMKDPYRATPDLNSLITTVNNLPLSDVRTARKQETNVGTKESASLNISTIVKDVSTSDQDNAMLKRDIIIMALSVSGVLLALVSTLTSWYLIHLPNQKATTDFVAMWGCGSVDNVFMKPVDTPVPTWMAAMKCTKFNATDPKFSSPELEDRIPKYGTYVRLLNALVFGTTLGVYAALVEYYRRQYAIKVREWSTIVMHSATKVLDKASTPYLFMRSSLMWQCCLELLVHSIFPYPWLPDNFVPPGPDYTLNDPRRLRHTFLEIGMVLRLYVVLRLVHHASEAYRRRHEIVRSNTRMRKNNYKISLADTIQHYLSNYTASVLIGAHLLVTLTGGLVLFLLERDHPEQKSANGLNEYVNAIYTMFVTIRTIGYGDYKAYTVQGRIATCVFATMGTAIEMLLGSVVINQFALSKDESYVNEFLKSNVAWWEYKVCSAMLIQAAWKG
eukprot:PhM_4_TR2484/c0_g2_i1/m.33944